MDKTAVILAAGLGTRMKSALPKAAHKIAGAPMLTLLIKSAEQVFDKIVVVIGPNQDHLAALAVPHATVIQHERLGTAHAALQAAAHFGDGIVAVFYADNPLVSAETMRELADRLEAGDAKLVLLATTPPAPPYLPGRVILDGDYVTRIVEYPDATPSERLITLCNAGSLTASALDMRVWLDAVRPMNAQREYYLTDIVRIAREEGAKIAAVEAPFDECMGINSRAELAAAEAAMQRRLRAAALENGVALQAPDTVFLCADTALAPDVTIGPYVVFGPGVTVKTGAEIGPTAHIGNFVEIKASTISAGAKVNHLTYIGDAEIGAHTNIGAGTITCNYDGKRKHRTKIGANAFIGSNTALVAPVTVGDGALIAAGSTITEDVPDNTLAIARGRQANKPRRAK